MSKRWEIESLSAKEIEQLHSMNIELCITNPEYYTVTTYAGHNTNLCTRPGYISIVTYTDETEFFILLMLGDRVTLAAVDSRANPAVVNFTEEHIHDILQDPRQNNWAV